MGDAIPIQFDHDAPTHILSCCNGFLGCRGLSQSGKSHTGLREKVSRLGFRQRAATGGIVV